MTRLATAIVGVLCAAAPALAQHTGHTLAADGSFKTPTVAVDADGRLWRAWVEKGHVLVGVSTDAGRSFGTPIEVTRQAESVDANGESRPKIAIGRRGEVYVTYTRLGVRPYTGDIRFSRSLDGGRTFEPPRTINDDGLDTGHRFDTLAVAPDGAVFVVWIDKRDLERATASQRAYEGAALYFTTSRDRGATFARNVKVKDHICECCRVAYVFDADGTLVLAWRDVMAGSIRDHAMTRIAADGSVGEIRRLTTDNWMLRGCPHHGPSLAVDGKGVLHVTWFTGQGPQGPGAWYGRFDPQGRALGAPRRLGVAATSGHAVVAVNGPTVHVAWKNADGTASTVMAMESLDGGLSFSAPREVLRGARAADHPLLVVTPGGPLLSWFAPDTGHRLVPLGRLTSSASTPSR